MARSQSGSGASGVTGAAPAGRGGGGKDLHCQHSGSQLFAAINVCMRNSCGCGSPSCAGQRRGERCVLKVFPGNLLLLQGEDKGCTADGKHRQLLCCSSCCWWEGTRCAWIFPAFLPSLPPSQAFIQLFVAWTVVPVGCCEALRAGLGKR